MRKAFWLVVLLSTVLIGCSMSMEDQLVGIWHAETQEQTPDGLVLTLGTTEYLSNGTSNTVGEMILIYYEEGEEVILTYSLMMSEEWEVKKDSLFEKVVDIKSIPLSLQVGTSKIDLATVDQRVMANLPKIEDIIPKGTSRESTIVQITEKRLAVKGKDAGGADKEYQAFRVKKHFSPQ